MKKRILIGFCVLLLVVSAMLSLVACKHDHNWEAEWTTNETHHWHGCEKKNCKEAKDKAEHVFSLDSNNFEHWQECEVCGYIKGREEHKFGSNLKCSVCGTEHTHILNYNDTKHWYACFGCNVSEQEANHTFKDGECTICAYRQGTKELEFELNSDGYTYKVVNINQDIDNPIRNVVIPEYYQGEKVTKIGASAFDGISSLNKIIIPNTIVEIEHSAFARCVGLAEIVIPKSVAKIGSRVFEDCYGLTIKAEAKSAPSGWDTSDWQINQWYELPIVWDCKNNDATKDGDIYFLNEIEDYANSVKYVIKGDKAYVAKQPRILAFNKNTGKLEDRDFVEFKTIVQYKDKTYDVVGIEDYAFYNYESIEEIEIKAAYTTIGESAFEGCTNIKQITWLSDPTNDISIEIGLTAFRNAISLTEINLPSQVAIIGAYSFSGCTRLREITIPNGTKQVKEGAFEDCVALVIRCEQPTKPEDWSDKWNIDNCPVVWDSENNNSETADGKIVYAVGLAVYLLDTNEHTATLLKQGALIDSTLTIASEITYPEDNQKYTLTAIGASAFAGDDFFTSIVIPASVKSIGDYAFSDCINIESITFAGNQITNIGSNAFAGCEKLTAINFAGTVTEWFAITKGDKWNQNTGEYKIVVADGTTIDKYQKE